MSVTLLTAAKKGLHEMEPSKTPIVDLDMHLCDASDLFRIIMMAGMAIEDEDDRAAVRTAAWEGIRKLQAAQEALSAVRAERREAGR